MRLFVMLCAAVLMIAAGCETTDDASQNKAMNQTSAAKPLPDDQVPCPQVKGESGKDWGPFQPAEYSAEQLADMTVLVHARGTLPNLGWEARLVRSKLEVFPPQLLFQTKRPTEPAGQVIKEFDICVTIPAKEKVETIIIHDSAEKPHEVKVEQARD